ncbi:hypothetical protein AVEN_208118-1 [Araneus ventricosus]|uniref:Uncharacterized protein n=1 Tax=Araneus ventricosus TaxID=182803 RepID=A0A4Y2EYJ2_ARAVE|nr:hypothetical protein AVEN_208118-1 [Araneus ventricosus]
MVKGSKHSPAGVVPTSHVDRLTHRARVNRDGWGRGTNILPLVCWPHPRRTDSPMGFRVHRDGWEGDEHPPTGVLPTSHVDRLTHGV